ncbi:MAG: hypothetical protein HY743_09825 [Deltaproteobacteria bacterium]|nr:hypothetical protein [Deltaproteobacteria bacterium]
MLYRKGTLRLSAFNLVELLKLKDKEQIESVLTMINSVDAGFINIDFLKVIKREDDTLALKGPGGNLSQELDIIYFYLLAQNWPEKWSIIDVIRNVLDNNPNEFFRKSWDQFALKMDVFLQSIRSDNDYITKSKNRSMAMRKEGKKYEAATRELWVFGMDFIFQNQTMLMPSKEWHDFYHTIVPVAYCHIVLLDKRWTTFISQTGLSFPDIALTFDRRSIGQFLHELETREF